MTVRVKVTRSGGLDALSARITKAVEKATYEAATDILAEADGNLQGPGPLVPVDTGALRNSGYATPPTIAGGVVSVEVGYGGVSAPYAATVHEKIEDGVNWSRPGSGPKFLENAVRNQAALFPSRLGYEISAAVRATKGR